MLAAQAVEKKNLRAKLTQSETEECYEITDQAACVAPCIWGIGGAYCNDADAGYEGPVDTGNGCNDIQDETDCGNSQCRWNSYNGSCGSPDE